MANTSKRLTVGQIGDEKCPNSEPPRKSGEEQRIGEHQVRAGLATEGDAVGREKQKLRDLQQSIVADRSRTSTVACAIGIIAARTEYRPHINTRLSVLMNTDSNHNTQPLRFFVYTVTTNASPFSIGHQSGFVLSDFVIQILTEDINTSDQPSSSLPACGEFLKRLPKGFTTSTEDCVICTIAFDREEPVTALDCGHQFHSSCLKEWLERRSTCPVCRQQCPSNDLEYLRSIGLKDEADRGEELERANNPLSRLEELRQLIRYALLDPPRDIFGLQESRSASGDSARNFDCDHCGCSTSRARAHYQCLDCSTAICVECYEVGIHAQHDSRHGFTYEPSVVNYASSREPESPFRHGESYEQLMADLNLFDEEDAGPEEQSEISIEAASDEDDDFDELLRSSGH